MIQQTGTSACMMRDKLSEAFFKNEITLMEIEDRLYEQEIPDWLGSQILQMVKYRQYDRITDCIEQAMERAVIRKIVREIIPIN